MLSSCYLFKELSESRLQRLNTINKETPLQKGQWLMLEGEKAEKLFVVKEGAVELLTKVDDCFELPIAMLRNQGDCTGTSTLVESHVYSLNSRCAEDSKMYVIKKPALRNLIMEDHELGCIIMKNLAQHLLCQLKETRQELKIYFKTIFRSTQP